MIILAAVICHQKQHCGMITLVTKTPNGPAIHLWVALVHKAVGQRLPEQTDMKHAEESTGGLGKKRGCD